MFKPLFDSRSIAFLFTAFAAFGTTQAEAVQRTHVSAAFGNDANTASNCTATAPCRFFQAAMSVTDTNGEVIVLDSGGYGAVTITKSVALIAPTGVYAGISVFPGANGVTIATPGVNVVFRGITINGQGGNIGILMTAGNRLTVDNCIISNLTQAGIWVSDAGALRVTDSAIRDNGSYGVTVRNGVSAIITRTIISGNGYAVAAEGTVASATTADIAETTMDQNQWGVLARSSFASATISVSVRNSHILRGGTGVEAFSVQGAQVNATASNNIFSNTVYALVNGGAGSKFSASGNVISKSLYGITNQSNGIFESAANNVMAANSNDVFGSVTVVSTR